MTNDELELFYLINEERKKRDLAFLKLDERLGDSAKQRNQILQENSTYVGFAGTIRNFTGATYSRIGEIIGTGYDNVKIIKSLAKYSGKTEYIFNPSYTHIGIGILHLFPKIKICTIHLGSCK